jgi:benzodiazapine receptor
MLMMHLTKKFQFFPFLVCLLIPLTIGAIGGFLTMDSVKTWYPTLNKPAFNPPNSIFGPVWTSLFLIMGVSSYLVWRKRSRAPIYYWAVGVYFLQLALNLTWSYLFFYRQQIEMALIEIVILLVAIVANALIFHRINSLSGWLFVPYLLWVSFASYLTYSIFILN